MEITYDAEKNNIVVTSKGGEAVMRCNMDDVEVDEEAAVRLCSGRHSPITQVVSWPNDHSTLMTQHVGRFSWEHFEEGKLNVLHYILNELDIEGVEGASLCLENMLEKLRERCDKYFEEHPEENPAE